MSKDKLSYKSSGVDIRKGDEATEQIKRLVKQTFNKQVLNEVGLFGGFFDGRLKGYRHPVLISSADGVGTKLKLAFLTGKHDTVGQDLVNHCVNDILVHGAKPLFFLDYFATGKLSPKVVASVVSGLAKACRANGCALIGGETAEMPGFYQAGEYDMAGFIVGVVDKQEIVDGSQIEPGDLIVGLPSSGLHTNGYSLARKLFFERLKLKPQTRIKELGGTVADALMAVHRSYLSIIMSLRSTIKIHGIAHITGGGIPGNLVRILPKNCCAVIDTSSWRVPPLFAYMQEKGAIDRADMFSAFNMGLGMLVVVKRSDIASALLRLNRGGEPAVVVGEIDKGKRAVVLE